MEMEGAPSFLPPLFLATTLFPPDVVARKRFFFFFFFFFFFLAGEFKAGLVASPSFRRRAPFFGVAEGRVTFSF